MSESPTEARYRDLAEARGVLLNAAARRIPLASLAAQARALTLWRHNQVEPGAEAQLACVMDLGIFAPVGGHKPALERLVNAGTPPEGSPDEAMLRALQDSRFSLFRIGQPDPRGGITLHDLCRDEAVWVMDEHLAAQGQPGFYIGARLVWPDEFAMTCGVVCPVDPRIMLSVLEGRDPLSGPVPEAVPPRADDPLIGMLLDEDQAPDRLAELAREPRLALMTYRAALDHGMLGPVPGRSRLPEQPRPV